MEGVVGCYSPNKFLKVFIKNHQEEMEGYEFSFSWAYISQTEIRIKIYACFKDVPESEYSFKEFIIDVPKTIEAEIWSRIELIDNQIYEGFIYEEYGNKIMSALSKGYDEILIKLVRNFKAGILDQSQFESSVRLLKSFRLQQLF
jgi:hypothetical protein